MSNGSPNGPNNLQTVAGQPSWRLAVSGVEAFVTRQGGMLAPVHFDIGGKIVQPYEVAPWAEEPVDPAMPSILKTLRGDFFCMPFGANEAPYGTEVYPLHGETANEPWTLRALTETAAGVDLKLSMETKVRPAHVLRELSLRKGQTVVYDRQTVSGAGGPMDFGHHATLQFPRKPGSGRVSTSRFVYGQVNPEPTEWPEKQGYNCLKHGAVFDDLRSVPTLFGDKADLSIYPSRQGYEDIAMLVSDPALPFAWTAVALAGEGYCWFALKDPRVLRNTVLWFSNTGRYYAPWSGRHLGVMGLEEVTAYFAYGLAESAGPNEIAAKGFPTSVTLSPEKPLVVTYIMGVAAIDAGFDRVAAIEPDGDGIRLIAESGAQAHAAVDLSFL